MPFSYTTNVFLSAFQQSTRKNHTNTQKSAILVNLICVERSTGDHLKQAERNDYVLRHGIAEHTLFDPIFIMATGKPKMVKNRHQKGKSNHTQITSKLQ